MRSAAPLKRPIDFGLKATPSSAHGKFTDLATEQEMWAFVTRGSYIGQNDGPQDPLRQFWSGSVDYKLRATDGDPQSPSNLYDPQVYEWFFDGDGTLHVPFDATEETRRQSDVAFSLPDKTFNHNLGEIDLPQAQEGQPKPNLTSEQFQAYIDQLTSFPKTTVVRGWVKKGGDEANAVLKSKATIDWHLSATSIITLTLRLEAAMGDDDETETRLAVQQGLEEMVQLLEESGQLDFIRTHAPQIVAEATVMVGEVVVEGIIEEVVTRGVGRLANEVRFVRAGEVGRTAFRSLRPTAWLRFNNYRALRQAAGKTPGNWKFAVKTKRSVNLGKHNTKQRDRRSSPDRDVDFPEDDPGSDEEESTEPQPQPTPSKEPSKPEEDGDKQDEQEEKLGAPLHLYVPSDYEIEDENNNGIIDEGEVKFLPYQERTDDNRVADKKVAPEQQVPMWPTAHYLTNLSPVHITPNPAINWAGLRKGQLSFALYGHPYEWDGAVKCISVLPQTMPDLHRPIKYKGDSTGASISASLYRTATLVGMRFGGKSMVSFVSGAPGVADVPPSDTLPATNGEWSDDSQRGNSSWHSKHVDVIKADKQFFGQERLFSFVPVPFARGYPDFSSWLVSSTNIPNTVNLPLQKGVTKKFFNPFLGVERSYSVDIVEADRQFAINRYQSTQDVYWLNADGQPDLWKAWLYRQNHTPRLTWHHHEDMKTMYLMPAEINNNVHHQGGASFAGQARWPVGVN